MQCVIVMIKRICNVFRFFICMLDLFLYGTRYELTESLLSRRRNGKGVGCFGQFFGGGRKENSFDLCPLTFSPSLGYEFLASGILKIPATKCQNLQTEINKNQVQSPSQAIDVK